MFVPISVGIFLFLLSGLAMFKPEVIWFITQSWKSSAGSEPSDFYLTSTRISGVVVLMVSFYMFYAVIRYS